MSSIILQHANVEDLTRVGNRRESAGRLVAAARSRLKQQDVRAAAELAAQALEHLDSAIPGEAALQLDAATVALVTGMALGRDSAHAQESQSLVAAAMRQIDNLPRCVQRGEATAVVTALTRLSERLFHSGQHLLARDTCEAAAQLIGQLPQRPSVEALRVLNNLSAAEVMLGNLARARRLLEESLADVTRQFGAQHPNTATILNNLGELTRQEARYADSRRYLENALQIRRTALGNQHPLIAQSINNLGYLALGEGRFRTARTLFDESLSRRREQGAIDNHQLISTLLGLAELSLTQGNYQEAERLLEEAAAVMGPPTAATAPRLAFVRSLLAKAYWKQGKQALARQALAVSADLYAQSQSQGRTTYAELLRVQAEIASAEGNSEDAIAKLQHALQLCRGAWGASHPELSRTLLMLGEAFTRSGQHSRARGVLKSAHQLVSEALGPRHVRLMDVHNTCARLACLLQRFEEAALYAEQSLDLARGAAEPLELAQIEALGVLATVRETQAQTAVALALRQQQWDLVQQTFGDQFPDRLDIILPLCRLLLAEHRPAEAYPLAEQVLRITRAQTSTVSLAAGDWLIQLAIIAHDIHDRELARRHLEDALPILKARLGADHPRTIKLAARLAKLCTHCGDHARAQALMNEIESLTTRDSHVLSDLM